MLADIKAGTAWQLNKSAGTLTNDSIAKLTRGSAIAPFVSGGGQSYLLTGAGKTLISDPANIATTMNSIPTALLAKISATSAGTITTPLVVQSVEAPTKSFLVYSKKKRLLVNAGQEAGLLKIAGFQTKVTWPGYALDALKTTNNVFSPAQIVKVKESGNIYLIDGWDRGWALTLDQAKAFGVAAPPEITRTNFSGYKTSTRLASQKFVCGNRTYLAEAGKLIPIEAAAVAQWPGAVTTFAANTCANLRLETVQIGALVTYGSNKYQVDGGKLRLIRTAAEYTALSQNRVAAVVISKTMFNLIPKGNPTSYVVVAGDSLSRVAVKFKTTKTVLRTINNLATEVLQRGQVLILP
jgi:LysM repeat protein